MGQAANTATQWGNDLNQTTGARGFSTDFGQIAQGVGALGNAAARSYQAYT